MLYCFRIFLQPANLCRNSEIN